MDAELPAQLQLTGCCCVLWLLHAGTKQADSREQLLSSQISCKGWLAGRRSQLPCRHRALRSRVPFSGCCRQGKVQQWVSL